VRTHSARDSRFRRRLGGRARPPLFSGRPFEPRNNIVWVPSLAAAIVGNIAFNQVHLSLRATDARARQAWHETLRLVQERHPRIVVAGHKNHPDLPDTADVLAFNQAYLAEFDAARAASHSAGELTAAMKKKFPAVGLDRVLSITAARFFRTRRRSVAAIGFSAWRAASPAG
jgi:hypothetical protein